MQKSTTTFTQHFMNSQQWYRTKQERKITLTFRQEALQRTLALKIDVARITKDTFLNLETRSNKLWWTRIVVMSQKRGPRAPKQETLFISQKSQPRAYGVQSLSQDDDSRRGCSGLWGKDFVFVVSSFITQPARARRTWNVVSVAADDTMTSSI